MTLLQSFVQGKDTLQGCSQVVGSIALVIYCPGCLKQRGGAQGTVCLGSNWCPGKCNHHGSSFRIITVDSIHLMIYWCPILCYLYSCSCHVVLIKSMQTFLRSLKMKVRSVLSVRWFIFSPELLNIRSGHILSNLSTLMSYCQFFL